MPPVDGLYAFYMSGDDGHKLYMSVQEPPPDPPVVEEEEETEPTDQSGDQSTTDQSGDQSSTD